MGSSTAYWYVPDRIVFVHNVGDLTANDFRGVDKQIIAFMRDAQHNGVENVHVLVDSTEMGKLPPLRDLEGGRILKYMAEPVCGWTIVVGYRSNTFLNILSRLLTSVMGVDLYMTDTFSKGLSLLQQVETSIPALPDVEAWKNANVGVPQNDEV